MCRPILTDRFRAPRNRLSFRLASRLSVPHLFVDISAHGLGHLGQVAPVVNALSRQIPGLELTVRSGLDGKRLRARIVPDFRHVATASDFGFVMIDALRVDRAANTAAYRAFHANWAERLDRERTLLDELDPDFVLTDVAYLPLAAAAKSRRPAAALSSLNWADLFAHYCGEEPWATPILAEMRDAYASASFLTVEPAMPVDWIAERFACGPVAQSGRRRRGELCTRLAVAEAQKLVLVALGGIPARLPVERWLGRNDIVWLVADSWRIDHPHCRAIETIGWNFPDLLASVDAVLTKPGYGTFVEAACAGTPCAYLRRDDWPEQEVLIAWLERHARACELAPAAIADGAVADCLDRLWRQPARTPVLASGSEEAASWLAQRLTNFASASGSKT